jgi:hypothetical protein
MAASAHVSDEALLGSLAEGDSNALAVLAGRYATAVHDFALRGTLDPVAASDITASVFRDLKPERGPSIGVRARILVATQHGVIDRENPAVPSRSKLSADDPSFVETRGPSQREPAMWAWLAARMLPLREYTLLDLVVRRGLTPEELRTVGGFGHRGIYASLNRVRDAFEEAYATLVLFRRGDCKRLRELLAGGATARSLTLRRQVTVHSKGCGACQGTLASFPDAGHAFLALPDLPLPDALPERTLGLVEQSPEKPARDLEPDIQESEQTPRPRGLYERMFGPLEARRTTGMAGPVTADVPTPDAAAAGRTRQTEPAPTESIEGPKRERRAPPAPVEPVPEPPDPSSVRAESAPPQAGPGFVQPAAELEEEAGASTEADKEAASAEDEQYDVAQAGWEGWEGEETYEYAEENEGWLEPPRGGLRPGPVSAAVGAAMADFRVLGAGVAASVSTMVSSLAGGQFLRNYALLGVVTAVALYLAIAIFSPLGNGGDALGEVPLVTDGSSITFPCEQSIEMAHGSQKRLRFDVARLNGFAAETVTVESASQSATPGGLTAEKVGPEIIVLRAASASGAPAKVDEYRMQLRLSRGLDVAFSTCSVKVNAGP